MIKITTKFDGHIQEIKNPDEDFIEFIRKKFQAHIQNELAYQWATIERKLRELKPNQKLNINTRPFKASIEWDGVGTPTK